MGFSLAISLGCSLVREETALLWSWRTPLVFALMAPAYTVLAGAALELMRGREARRIEDEADPRRSPCGASPAITHAVATLVLLAAWAPVLLATWPGAYYYDAHGQLPQALGIAPLTTHHPVAHTLLLRAFVLAGQALFGSQQAGAAMLTAFQMVALALMFGKACSEVASTCGRVPGVLALLWFALCPAISLQTVAFTKDVPFAGLFCMSLLYLARVLRVTKERPTRGDAVCLCLFLLASMLFRNNAAHAVVVASVPVATAAVRKREARHIAASVSVATALLAYGLVAGPAYGALGAEDVDGLAESMSVPMQQLARSALLGEVTQDEESYVRRLMPSYESYRTYCSDTVKDTFDQVYLVEDPLAFARTYASVGLKNAREYADAFLLLTYRSWYPFARYDYTLRDQGLPLHSHPAESYGDAAPIVADSKAPGLLESMTAGNVGAYGRAFFWWAGVPVVSVLLSTGGIIWMCALMALLAAIRREGRFERLAILAFPTCYWATLLLGPMVLARYEMCLFTSLPVCAMVVFADRTHAQSYNMFETLSTCSE